MSDFIEISVDVSEPVSEHSDIIVAFLSEYDFNTFDVAGPTVKAYAGASQISDTNIEEIQEKISAFSVGKLKVKFLEKENWNAIWEKNYFEPIVINKRIGVRAAFQKPLNGLETDIVIQPKMSFGTGHHSTTQLMVEWMLEFEKGFGGITVLDMGAGTGILAIVSEILGASKVVAVDIEDWAVENIRENAKLNRCSVIDPFHGDATFLRSLNQKFDIILANIHKSVLISDSEIYISGLRPGGLIFLSGFYENDLEDIRHSYENLGCDFIGSRLKNEWCAAVFKLR